MIAIFLLTVAISTVTMMLIFQWLARRDHALGLRRLTGRPPAVKGATARAAEPVLMQVPAGAHGRLAKRLLLRLNMRGPAEHLLETADLKWGAVGLIHRCAAGSLAASLAVLVATRNSLPLLTFLAGVVGAIIPLQWARRLARLRIRKFEEQFPDCLEFISRSMRAGHAFSVALEMVHKEFSEPLAGEFRRTYEEQNLGQPLDIVLKKMAYRMPSLDTQFFVSAVLLQKRTGGNLAELLDKLADIIRQRFKLRARIRAISAQGLMSGRILASIPAAVGILMYVVNPVYARFFVDDPAGHEMLAAAFGLQLIGYWIIKKIVTIEV
jgi:tight adherence protein B